MAVYEWVSINAQAFIEDPAVWIGKLSHVGVLITDDDDEVIALLVPPGEAGKDEYRA